MKKFILATSILSSVLFSCDREEDAITNHDIQFAFVDNELSAKNSSDFEPKNVVVTILDNSGNTIVDQEELALLKFGDNFLSLPLTLHASGSDTYRLSEFLVTDAENRVRLVTPKEGSEFAHLVSDPLDIGFRIDKDSITTIMPQVVAVDENSDPEDYGYAQFGFQLVETLNLVFSSFARLESGIEPTACALTIEGLYGSSTSDTITLWTHHVDLDAKVNTIVLKNAHRYRITAHKEGFKPWTASVAPLHNNQVDIFFEKAAAEAVDVYLAGYENEAGSPRAMYWKNGTGTRLSLKFSKAAFVSVSNGDVYVAGTESGTNQPFYWKNGEQIFLPSLNGFPGDVQAVYAFGNDIYAVGAGYDTYPGAKTTPVCWKNGTVYRLPVSDLPKHRDGRAQDITMIGSDLYICGNEAMPVVWKNGERQELVLPEPIAKYRLYSKVVDIDTEDGNVYVYGVTGSTPIDIFDPPPHPDEGPRHASYWKNNELTQLREFLMLDDNYEIDIFEGNFYSTSWKGILYPQYPSKIPTSSYWKNNEETVVDAGFNTNVHCIDVVDGNVYMAGDFRKIPAGAPSVATYWINGTRFTCSEKSSFALSMFVDKK